jgi:hypothetical protein
VFITHLHLSGRLLPGFLHAVLVTQANPGEPVVFKLFIASLEPKWARRTGRNQNGAAKRPRGTSAATMATLQRKEHLIDAMHKTHSN